YRAAGRFLVAVKRCTICFHQNKTHALVRIQMMAQMPKIADALRLERLHPPTGKVRMVLDTDTYNEVDDQFALVYALLSPDSVAVEAIYAAPFHNNRSSGPADGMEKSYEEIMRL